MHGGDRIRATTLAAGLIVAFAGQVSAQEPPPDTAVTERQRKLEERCAAMKEEERRKTVECQTEAEKREDAYRRRIEKQIEEEKDGHSSFLKWLHVDGMWVPTEMGSSTYGIIGTHIVVAEIGRIALFGPPGVMLLATREGEHWRMRPAFTWGVSVYLSDFRWPGSRQEARLFLNVGKVWTTGDYRTGMDMAGLSVTWKR